MPKLLQPSPATVTWMPESPSCRAACVCAMSSLPPCHEQVPHRAQDALDRDLEGLAAVLGEPDGPVHHANVERGGVGGVAGGADGPRPPHLRQAPPEPPPPPPPVTPPLQSP